MDTKIAGHLRNPQPDSRIVISQAFQSKGKLMPDFIRYDLIIRVLHDKTDLLALCPVVNPRKRHPPVKDFSL